MIETIKFKKYSIAYDVCTAILALTAVFLSVFDLSGKITINNSPSFKTLDSVILSVFTIDYLARFVLSKDKKKFFRDNIMDLIAIIPFSSFFRIFRISRLFRLVRLSKFMKLMKFARFFAFAHKFNSKVKFFLHTNGFIYVIYLTVVTILLGSVGIYFVEYSKTINSYGDALWWSFVTATTVGYGDISPVTGIGRIIAAVLMLVGIGFIGMLTGTIATFFLDKTKRISEQPISTTVDLSDLSEKQLDHVMSFIEFIRNKD